MKTLNELVEEQVEEFDKKFSNPNKYDSSGQFNPILRGKLYQEFVAFLRFSLKTVAQATADALRMEKPSGEHEIGGQRYCCGKYAAISEAEKKAKDFFTEPCVECGHPDGHSNTCVLVE